MVFPQNNLRLEDESEAKKNPRANLKHVNNETRDILDTLDKEYKVLNIIVTLILS